jgi:hypothetical protein
MNRRMLRVLLILGSLFLATAGATAQTYEVPYSANSQPAMNGRIAGDPGWSKASVYQIPVYTIQVQSVSQGDVQLTNQNVGVAMETVYVVHDGTWLYLGVQTHLRNWGPGFWLGAYINGNGDGKSHGAPSPESPTVDFEILQGGPSAASLTYYAWNAYPKWGKKKPPKGTSSATSGDSDVSFVFKVSIKEMGNTAGGKFGMILINGLSGPINDWTFSGLWNGVPNGWPKWRLAAAPSSASSTTSGR